MNLLFSIALAAQAAQTTSAEQFSPRYLDCVSLVEADVEIGRISAQQWVAAGGGSPAQHCLAIADLAAGFPKLAAARLEEITLRDDAGDEGVRAKLLAQAAEAWLDADLPQNAENAVSRGLELAPTSAELLLLAARVYTELDRPADVIKAVTTAEKAGFGSAAGFVARGRAYFKSGDLEAAAEDVVSALSIDSYNVDALVLRGDLQLAGITIDVEYGSVPAE